MNFKRLSVTRALLSGTVPTHGVQPANYSSKHADTHTWCREPQVSNQDERDSATEEEREERNRERREDTERETEITAEFDASCREIPLPRVDASISVILCITEKCFQ